MGSNRVKKRSSILSSKITERPDQITVFEFLDADAHHYKKVCPSRFLLIASIHTNEYKTYKTKRTLRFNNTFILI